jgi:hypothetical protein
MHPVSPWVVASLLLLGAGTYSETSWKGVRQAVPEISRKDLEPTLGQGVLLGILGGLRTVVADATWLRSYVFWEKRDRAGCEALMKTACALDPRSRFFWENTGYAVGYDFAHWEIRRRGGYAKVAPDIQEGIFRRYAQLGLAIFEDGVEHTGGNSGILISAGQLAEIKLKDNLLAAAYYRRATQAKTVPWFAYFMCARTMWEAGQKKEAYEWYRTQWLGKLKKDEDGAPDDLDRLRFMEDELKVPVQLRIPRQTWEK